MTCDVNLSMKITDTPILFRLLLTL